MQIMGEISILLFVAVLTLTGAEVPLQVVQRIGSVNGSDINMGCASPLVDRGGMMVCNNSRSYLIDGCSLAIDTSTSNWASQLVTVKRNERNSVLTVPHVVLTFVFNTAVLPTSVELDTFFCHGQNTDPPFIYVYADNRSSLVLKSTERTLGSVQLSRSCHSLSTASISLKNRTASSYNSWHILVDLHRRPAIQWVYVGEVRFLNTTNPAPSCIARPPGIISTTDIISSIMDVSLTASHPKPSESAITTSKPTISQSPFTTSAGDSVSNIGSHSQPSSIYITRSIESGITVNTDAIPTSTIVPTSGTVEIGGIVIGLLVGLVAGLILTILIVLIIVVWRYCYNSSKSHPDHSIEFEKFQTAVGEPIAEVDNGDYSEKITFDEPVYEPVADNLHDSHDSGPGVSNPIYATIAPSEPEDACKHAEVEHTSTPSLPKQGLDKKKAKDLPIYSVVKKGIPGVPPKSSDLLTDLASQDDEKPSASVMDSPPVNMPNHEEEQLDCTSENPLHQRSDSPSLPAGTQPINVIHLTPSDAGNGTQPTALPLESSLNSDSFSPSVCTSGGNKESSEVLDCDLHISTAICDDPKELPKGFQQPLQITNDNIKEIRELGNGRFGKVMLALTNGLSLKDMQLSKTDNNPDTSIHVAIKKLIDHPSKEQKESFMKEVKFMSSLKHQNVVSLLGVCYDEPAFMMMEYMEEGDLNQFLERYSEIVETPINTTQISTSTVVSMASQIASAMKYLASLNFVHRDLACRNCLVGKNVIVKLADFGMSRNLYESHYYRIQGNAVLPIRWMATECFYGKFSEETDVWAFGITMWELFTLAKNKPYSHFTDQEVIEEATERGPTRQLLSKPAACPGSVYSVMKQCWDANPKKRARFSALDKMLRDCQ